MTEKEICERLYAYHREGAKRRHNGTSNPHPANTLRHMMSSNGWLQEDLRLALMRASPSYCYGQAMHENPEWSRS